MVGNKGEHNMSIIKVKFDPTFSKNAELAEELYNVITEYEGEVALAEVLGVLEIIKYHLIKGEGL